MRLRLVDAVHETLSHLRIYVYRQQASKLINKQQLNNLWYSARSNRLHLASLTVYKEKSWPNTSKIEFSSTSLAQSSWLDKQRYRLIEVELPFHLLFIFTYTIYLRIHNWYYCDNIRWSNSSQLTEKSPFQLKTSDAFYVFMNSILFETKHMRFHTNFTHCFAFK